MPEPIEVIITDPSGKVIFGAGKGALSRNQKISGTLTLSLSLFANKVVNEAIQFVRFENHRMIFVTLASAPDMYAVSLVQKDIRPAQFVPLTSVFLDIIGRLYTSRKLTKENRQELQSLYEYMSMPTDGLLIAPLSSTGFYSTLVIAIGLIYDLGFFDAQKVISRLHYVKFNEISELIKENSPHGILSCFKTGEMPQIEGIKHLVTTETLNSIMSSINGEGKDWEITAHVFGDDSNAMRVSQALTSERAEELGRVIDYLKPEDRDLLFEALRNCVLSPEDTIETLESLFGHKVADLPEISVTPEPVEPEIPPEVPMEHTKITFPEVIPEELPPEITPVVQEIPEVQETPITEEIIETPPTPEVELDVPPPVVFKEELVDVKEETYNFASCPIEIVYCKGSSFNQVKPVTLERKLTSIVILVFEKSPDVYDFQIALNPERAKDVKSAVDDIVDRFKGQKGESYPGDLVFSATAEKSSKIIRALAWTSLTEFLRQMQMKLLPPSEALLFLNEGSIMMIPPKRRFDRKQLPSQILKIVSEQEVEDSTSKKITNPILLQGAIVDDSLIDLVVPLKQGAGVAFVPRDDNEEMPEIMLWLLTISEVSGVGFSRW